MHLVCWRVVVAVAVAVAFVVVVALLDSLARNALFLLVAPKPSHVQLGLVFCLVC